MLILFSHSRMSLQYNTSRGCILPIGSLVCGLCRESHLKGIDLSHSKLMTRKDDSCSAAAEGGPSVVVTVMPPEVKQPLSPPPPPQAKAKSTKTVVRSSTDGQSSGGNKTDSKKEEASSSRQQTTETIFTKISKLNEALNAINPRYKPIGFSITSIESCSPSVLQDATLATETAISTLMSVIGESYCFLLGAKKMFSFKM